MTAISAQTERLARSWMAALVMARPLEAIGELSLGAFALEAPALCAQAIRALQSDLELDRLTGQGAATGREGSAPALRLGAIAGSPSPTAAVEAVEVLRGVLWEALLEEVGPAAADRSTVRRVADVSDRLAHVCACLLAAAVSSPMGAVDRRAAEAAREEATHSSTGEPEVPSLGERRMPMAVIVDEHDAGELRSRALEPPPPSWDESPPVRPAGARRGGPGAWEEHRGVAPGAPDPEIEIRDERAEDGPAAWIGSIGRELGRHREDGRPFAVLLVEPVDMELLRDAPDELARVDEGCRAGIRKGRVKSDQHEGLCLCNFRELEIIGPLR